MRHWAKGLCRSCYRRLSVTHRLYNDKWNEQNSQPKESRKSIGKKEYKYVDPASIEFEGEDIETLLDRYDWRCAYSGIPLQGHDHRRKDAFQLEYVVIGDKLSLVPVCRSVNCSKKSLKDPDQLKNWARKNNLPYPFKFVTVEEYYALLNLD